jgi:hypothetical protein
MIFVVVKILLIPVGLLALVTGYVRLSPELEVSGISARVMGFIALLPIPLAMLLTALVKQQMAAQADQVDQQHFEWVATQIEWGCLGGCILVLMGLVRTYGRKPRPMPETSEAPTHAAPADSKHYPSPNTNITAPPATTPQDDRLAK